jgi:hypothetical protein
MGGPPACGLDGEIIITHHRKRKQLVTKRLIK